MDPVALTTLLNPSGLINLARVVGLVVKGIRVESVEGPLGRFDDERDEADIDETLQLVTRMEAIVGL